MQFWKKEYMFIASQPQARLYAYIYSREVPVAFSDEFFGARRTIKPYLSGSKICAQDKLEDTTLKWQLELNLCSYRSIRHSDLEFGHSSLNIKCNAPENFHKLKNKPFFEACRDDFSYTVTFDWEQASYSSNLIAVLNTLSTVLPDGEKLATDIYNRIKESRPRPALRLTEYSKVAPFQICCIS